MSQAIALLKTALALLILLQSATNVPADLRAQANAIVNDAIQSADQAIAAASTSPIGAAATITAQQPAQNAPQAPQSSQTISSTPSPTASAQSATSTIMQSQYSLMVVGYSSGSGVNNSVGSNSYNTNAQHTVASSSIIKAIADGCSPVEPTGASCSNELNQAGNLSDSQYADLGVIVVTPQGGATDGGDITITTTDPNQNMVLHGSGSESMFTVGGVYGTYPFYEFNYVFTQPGTNTVTFTGYGTSTSVTMQAQ
ncbi:MAG: hypothetical protein P4L81_04230 [Candidatus Pacebacteria bacterium]|nr:hypothetical protein [Candidatus Paceibacterota bacterium]